MADPAATLKAEGAELPAGMRVKAVENTDKVFHLVIPAKPTDLSDDDLDKVAGEKRLVVDDQWWSQWLKDLWAGKRHGQDLEG